MSNQLRYNIRHRTAYEYSGRIDLCHSLLHLAPCNQSDQKVVDHKLEIAPEPGFESQRKDYFGNTVHYFSVQQSHDQLDVTSLVTVLKSKTPESIPNSRAKWDDVVNREKMRVSIEAGIPLLNYLEPTSTCPIIPELDTFLAPSLSKGREIIDLAGEVMARIFTEFDYKPGTTENSTPLSDILAKKAGVCQDFAHVMIAALRSIGIPARYVSGYLETVPPPGQEKLQGADATHAWVEVYTPSTGWVDFDPTNNKRPGHQHIKICHGRDYFDVQPLRGTFLGAGNQRLIVEVDVERI